MKYFHLTIKATWNAGNRLLLRSKIPQKKYQRDGRRWTRLNTTPNNHAPIKMTIFSLSFNRIRSPEDYENGCSKSRLALRCHEEISDTCMQTMVFRGWRSRPFVVGHMSRGQSTVMSQAMEELVINGRYFNSPWKRYRIYGAIKKEDQFRMRGFTPPWAIPNPISKKSIRRARWSPHKNKLYSSLQKIRRCFRVYQLSLVEIRQTRFLKLFRFHWGFLLSMQNETCYQLSYSSILMIFHKMFSFLSI